MSIVAARPAAGVTIARVEAKEKSPRACFAPNVPSLECDFVDIDRVAMSPAAEQREGRESCRQGFHRNILISGQPRREIVAFRFEGCKKLTSEVVA